jgi:thymidylate synthase
MTDQKDENEAYSYGSRLCSVPILNELLFFKKNHVKSHIKKMTMTINQIDEIIWTYKNKGHRNNQMVLQIAQPTDLVLYDPPCLRHIFVRIQNGSLHFFPFFRSNDLWGGFPANLAGIEILKQYMAGEIGVNNGEIIYSCSGLHLYDYVWESAKILRGK